MNRKRTIKRKELVHIVTRFHDLLTASGFEESKLDLQLATRIVDAYWRWSTCEGLPGVKRAKLMSNYFIRCLVGQPLDEVPLSNRYKRLIQKSLLICEGSPTPIKVYWVSIFSAVRLFILPPVVDVSTIEGRFSGSLLGLFRYWKYLRRTKLSFSSAIPPIQNWQPEWNWAISGASGPNGPESFTQYLNDLRSLSHTGALKYGLIILLYSIPYSNKRETVKALRDALIDSLEKGDPKAIHSRLVFLSDKAGKTRVVAIGDILSQSFLKSVHQRCNSILRRLKQDGTFDQDHARRRIQSWSALNKSLASMDLSSATDRMPVLFQVFVLIYLRILSPLQALGWYMVTTWRDFHYYDEGQSKRVRYAVGQPMGMLSSWPVMAISHHFLVRLSFAASEFKYNLENSPYRVLGDDLTLLGFGVAEVYQDIIRCLGIDISWDKSYIARGVAEFAKCVYCDGKDLSPFPLALLVFNKNTVVSSTLAIIAQCKRFRIPLTAKSLTELFPKRWRNLVVLAALSPTSPKYGLDLQPRSDFWVFLQFVYCQRIKYFSRLRTVRDSTHAFAIKDPGKSGKRLASPFLQIATDNESSYPVRRLGSKKPFLSPLVLLGQGWISYCPICWPDGLPPLGHESLIPGPTYSKDSDSNIFRNSLVMFNRLLPDYFTVRCVGKQVGE